MEKYEDVKNAIRELAEKLDIPESHFYGGITPLLFQDL